MVGKNTVNMTEGNYKRIIISFALPIFLSQLFQQLYNSIDALIVGNFLGETALAAVSSSGSLSFLFVGFFMGVGSGSGVAIGRYFGAGNIKKVQETIHNVIILGIICGLLMGILGFFFAPIILELMGTTPEVLPQSVSYFRVYFCGAITLIMYNFCNGILNAMGDSKRPLKYLIISSCLNIVLDLLFVGFFRWGVWAAAFATILAQGISAVLCLYHLTRPGTIYQIHLKQLIPNKDLIGEVLKYGLPSGIQNSVISIGNIIIQSNINSFGTTAMAGCGSYFKVEGFVFLPITAFSLAMTTFIAQNLGARKYDRARQGARFGIISGMALAEGIGFIMYFSAPFLIGLFGGGEAAIQIGISQARTECFFYCFLAMSHLIAGVCRGAGKAIVPMCVMLGVWCAFRILYVTVAMMINHWIILVFLAYPITWSISSIIYVIYYFKSDWIHGFEKI